MGVWKLVRLKFGRCPAHFGELGIGMEETNERIRSDTLFSAWLTAYARLSDRSTINKFVQQFHADEPPFRLSSAYLYHTQNDKMIDYLLRPLVDPPGYTAADKLTLGKSFKKLKYLPLEVWQRWYQGAGFTEGDRQELLTDLATSPEASLASLGTFDYSAAFKFHRVPKVAIDRTSRATNFYHTGFVQYRWQSNSEQPDGVESLSGLYFLVYFPNFNSVLADTFFAVLDFLGGEGIGGDRSSGAGQFKLDADAKEQALSAVWQSVVEYGAGKQHCLTSLLWQQPLPQTLLDGARYELQERGGWITSPVSDGRQLRRKAVRMFAEGSVFSERPSGQLANVTPPHFTDHDIYRSGISLSLPINTVEG